MHAPRKVKKETQNTEKVIIPEDPAEHYSISSRFRDIILMEIYLSGEMASLVDSCRNSGGT